MRNPRTRTAPAPRDTTGAGCDDLIGYGEPVIPRCGTRQVDEPDGAAPADLVDAIMAMAGRATTTPRTPRTGRR